MIDADGFRIEAALQLGATEVEGSEVLSYLLSETELIAFAKMCERKGRAEAMQLVRRELNNPLNAKTKSPLLTVLGTLTKRNQATDVELAPVLEAERQRALAKQGIEQ